ncbi:MAG: DUF6445 family protein [Pseudomonadota bacterium]
MTNYALNPARTERCERLGAEASPLLVVDDAFADPKALRAEARRAAWETVKGAGNHFPGVRAPAPAPYGDAVLSLLKAHLAPAFGLEDWGEPEVALRHFSIVATPPAALSLPQRIPHFDTPDPGQIAVLHYLAEGEFGGTSFYRHRATGFERIGPDRFHPYTSRLVAEVKREGPPSAAYIRGSTAMFEQIGGVDARPNRLVAYFSNALHSGDVPSDRPLSTDPDAGRLSISTFLRFAAT